MSNKYIRLNTPQQKEIHKHFQHLAARYDQWEVWSDFITLFACNLCVSSRIERNKESASIAKRYKPEDIEHFTQMFAQTVSALEQNPDQDFLGDLFMRFGLSNTWKGQFFTPYNICSAMSIMTATDIRTRLKSAPWVSVNDPACGAGALLIAFAQECLRQKVDYQKSVVFVAQDVDRTAALMCFIQLSLIGCPGYIVVGDSILNPVTGPSVLLPVRQEGQEIWFTPLMYTNIWQQRIAIEKFKLLGNG